MSKLPGVGNSIFSVMSQLANEHQAINLAQGFPNFPVNPRLIELLQETAGEANAHQYAPMAGHPRLLNALKALTQKVYGRNCSTADEILVCAGATQGIFTTIQALVTNGDEVVVLDPAYDCYLPAITLAGGKAISVNLDENYLPDWEKIEKAINTSTRALLINNPHNPSGNVWSESDYIALEKLAEKFPDLLILSDEVYEYIHFEKPHISIHQREKLRERSIIFSSFGKTFHVTGWKMAYVIAAKNWMDEIKKVHQFLVFSVNSVAQITLAKYLEEVDVTALGGFYQEKRNFFNQHLKGSRFEFTPSQGSYFQVVSYAVISQENDVDFCIRLVKEHGVAAIPMSVFYQDKTDRKHIRLCFAKTEETLIQAAEKLCQI